MVLNKPYPHIYRHGAVNSTMPYYEAWKSEIGINCLASYEILKRDLKQLFEYIEPCQSNLFTFSHRTFELLVRACIEVEALCKMVFAKNNVTLNRSNSNIIRYSDLNAAMRLSEYEILSYGFHHPPFAPFQAFANPVKSARSPAWYRAYNNVKHNRTDNFSDASIGNVIQAVGGVYVLLVAQFGFRFDHKIQLSFTGSLQDSPDFFRVRELPQWSDAEQYQFDWESLKSSAQPYAFHPLPEIP
jgi:hypothetical protein